MGRPAPRRLEDSRPRPAPHRETIGRLLRAGLEAADPDRLIAQAVSRRGSTLTIGPRRYDLRRIGRLLVCGAGKASGPMAAAIERILGDRLDGGLVIVKQGHRVETTTIDLVEAGHPIPDRAGLAATAKLLALMKPLAEEDLVILLLSGGGSSLLVATAEGLSLADKQRTTDRLLRSGAPIGEINTVRKHLSAVKGGRLAAATQARIATLILSDVLGPRWQALSSIASGPTVPDPTTYRDAVAVLRRRHIWRDVPQAVRRHLTKGCRGEVADTPKPGSSLFRHADNFIVGDNRATVAAVAREAKARGFVPRILTAALTGEAKEAGTRFARLARRLRADKPRRPVCVIAGGELTVTVAGRGKGGRCQEFALAAAIGIEGLAGVTVAGFGTDGTDGPTDAAGAVVDGSTVARGRILGLHTSTFLARNDAYRYFDRVGGLLRAGPTGTNVNDLYLMIVD